MPVDLPEGYKGPVDAADKTAGFLVVLTCTAVFVGVILPLAVAVVCGSWWLARFAFDLLRHA